MVTIVAVAVVLAGFTVSRTTTEGLRRATQSGVDQSDLHLTLGTTCTHRTCILDDDLDLSIAGIRGGQTEVVGDVSCGRAITRTLVSSQTTSISRDGCILRGRAIITIKGHSHRNVAGGLWDVVEVKRKPLPTSSNRLRLNRGRVTVRRRAGSIVTTVCTGIQLGPRTICIA